ncbi:hypothetical protein ACU4GD_24480 [Cupriavidus basilensis]
MPSAWTRPKPASSEHAFANLYLFRQAHAYRRSGGRYPPYQRPDP